MFYVISQDGKPLMPTKKQGKVRRLLKEGKARIVRYEPFTIQLLYNSKIYIQKVIAGLDTGYNRAGSVAITEEGRVLYGCEAELRQGISELVSTRANYRKSRRSRKTRYRRPKERYTQKSKKEKKSKNHKRAQKNYNPPPTFKSKVDAHEKIVKEIKRFLPVSEIRLEMGLFDVQALLNPEITGKEYQNGKKKGYDSVREYVKFRDNYTCQYAEYRPDIPCCKKLVMDHIIPKSKGGTYNHTNLICSCHNHNQAKDNMSYEEFTGHKAPHMEDYRESAFMNCLRTQLIPKLEKIAPVSVTYGYITRRTRKEFGLEKSHINDAIAIAGIKPVEFPDTLWKMKQVRKKKRSLHEANPRKGRKTPNITQKRNSKNTKEIIRNGFKWCLWDKVYIEKLDKIGYISGFTGKMVYIQDMEGNYLQVSPKYKQISNNDILLIQRNNNYISERSDSEFISS